MKTLAFAAIVLVTGWALVPGVGTAEVIVNGDFETGDLTGWTRVDDEGMGGGTPWTVLFDEMKGSHVAYANWDYRVHQEFEPVRGEEVERFELELMTAEETSTLVELTYADGFLQSVWIPSGPYWQAVDLLPEVEPGRDLAGVLISGPEPGLDSRIWVDNVTLQAQQPDAVLPGCPEPDLIVAADVDKVLLRTNQKRTTTQVVVRLTAPEEVLLTEGEVEVKLQFIQDGSIVEFDADAELVNVPQRNRRIVHLQDRGSGHRQEHRGK